MADLNFTDNDFKTQVLGNSGIVVVDFWAPWCGPCRAVSPVIDELAKEYTGSVSKSALMPPASPLKLLGPPPSPKPMSPKPSSPLKLLAPPKSPKPATPVAREVERAKQKTMQLMKQRAQAELKQRAQAAMKQKAAQQTAIAKQKAAQAAMMKQKSAQAAMMKRAKSMRMPLRRR